MSVKGAGAARRWTSVNPGAPSACERARLRGRSRGSLHERRALSATSEAHVLAAASTASYTLSRRANAARTDEPMDIQERLTAFAMLGAGWVMWLLVGLSVLGVAIMLERWYFFFQTRDDLGKLSDALLAKLRANDVEGARTAMKASPSTEALVALAGLDSVEDGHASAGTRMAKESQLARLSMERNLAFLGTVGNNAPFVGLLGTVIGVIRAFHELNESGGAVSAGLMAEVGEALVATAIGLLVALPSVAAFNFFQRIIKTRINRGEALGKEVLAYLESGRKPAPAAKAAPQKDAGGKGASKPKSKPADDDGDEDEAAAASAE